MWFLRLTSALLSSVLITAEIAALTELAVVRVDGLSAALTTNTLPADALSASAAHFRRIIAPTEVRVECLARLRSIALAQRSDSPLFTPATQRRGLSLLG